MIPELGNYDQYIDLISTNPCNIVNYNAKSKTFLFKIVENPDILADPVFDGREMPNSLQIIGKTKTVIFKFYTYLKDSRRAYYLAEGDENYFFVLEW